MSRILVDYTLTLSLFIQIIIILGTSIGLFIQVEPKDFMIKQIFILEYIVQIIEAAMYVWLSYSVINSATMVKRRYIDWFITTPIMLFTTVLYMKYNTTDHNISTPTLYTIFTQERDNLFAIFGYNAFMLICGLTGELYPNYSKLFIPIGFYFFYKVFYTIYDKFVEGNIINTRLFVFITAIWSLYGVAALFSSHIKNICYNILDIISKNFYEIYIFWIMVTLN
tara:strand:+ start:9996 stop:10667 length:672 start_codon:yes stop_codon:yes gene_type:complete